jgi:hypothetical protein
LACPELHETLTERLLNLFVALATSRGNVGPTTPDGGENPQLRNDFIR